MVVVQTPGIYYIRYSSSLQVSLAVADNQFQVVTRTKVDVDKIHTKNVQFQGLIYFKMLSATLIEMSSLPCSIESLLLFDTKKYKGNVLYTFWCQMTTF